MATESLVPLLDHLRYLAQTPSLRRLSDRELLERFLTGEDQDAFATLIHRNGKLVVSACRQVLSDPADIEDVFQATFLTLLGKASTVPWQPSLGSWLYGTAHRIALQARTSARRRIECESQARVQGRGEVPAVDLSWTEAVTILHEELDRLPERYRLPLLLCYLQGKSRDETAEHLGLTTGVVKWRLERGRALLRKRLVGRGITLSAGLLGAIANSSRASSVPSRLVQATLNAATAGPRARVAALTAGVSTAMFSNKVKGVSCLLVCLGILLGVAGYRLTLPASSASPAAEKATPPDKPTKPVTPSPPSLKEGKTITLHGQVLDPEGKPVVGAALLLVSNHDTPLSLGTSEAEGRFSVEVPRNAEHDYLVVQQDRTGIDFLDLTGVKASTPVKLRLVKDQPIRGRIIDTEGKPVPGVKVQARNVGVYQDNSMDSFLTAWKKRHFMSGIPGGVKYLWDKGGTLFTTRTNAEGRFVLRGAGAERLVALRLSGARIAHTDVWVVNRQGFDAKPYNEASRENIPKGMERFALRWVLYGPNLSVVVEAGKTIRGVVKDADTGKPLPDTEVLLTRSEDGRLVTLFLKGTSDARGRYEIRGVHKAKKYMVEVKSDPKMGYMAAQVWADDTPAHQPVVIDIAMKKGVLITGRVLDARTGKPLPGFAQADVLPNNPFAKRYPTFDASAYMNREQTVEDGTFRVVAIPGPVLLMGGPDPRRLPNGYQDTVKYKLPVADPGYPQYFRMFKDHTAFITSSGGFMPIQGNFCKVLEIDPKARVVQQDILLERTDSLTIHIQDREGKPLPGTLVTGISPRNWHHPILYKQASCSAHDLEPGKSRRLVFFHRERKLVGTRLLAGNEKQPLTVKLGPAGSLKGKLVGTNGKPLPGVMVEVHYRDREASEIHEVIHEAKLVVTDKAGAFTIDDLIPEVEFKLTYRQGRQKYERDEDSAEKISVKPGKSRDLGTIHVKAVTGE